MIVHIYLVTTVIVVQYMMCELLGEFLLCCTCTCIQVFFPMLSWLLEDIVSDEKISLEETRVRSSNLLCKVRRYTCCF